MAPRTSEIHTRFDPIFPESTIQLAGARRNATHYCEKVEERLVHILVFKTPQYNPTHDRKKR